MPTRSESTPTRNEAGAVTNKITDSNNNSIRGNDPEDSNLNQMAIAQVMMHYRLHVPNLHSPEMERELIIIR